MWNKKLFQQITEIEDNEDSISASLSSGVTNMNFCETVEATL